MKSMMSARTSSPALAAGLMAGEVAQVGDDLERNRLLAMLSGDARARLAPDLEPVSLPVGEFIFDAGDNGHHVYFPADSIVSLQYAMESGVSTEISVVGNEGMVGMAAFLDGSSPCSQAIVQSAGTAYRLPGRLLKDELDQQGELLRLMLRYTQSLLTQISQTVVCNRHHSVEKRVCRRLLLALDRLPGDEMTLTQEMLASMLGVRREGVTAAAGRLRRLGVIQYRRGHIKVLDRARLEQLSCECYAIVKNASDRFRPARAVAQAH